MSGSEVALIAGGLSVAGTVIGVVVGVWLNNLGEARRWQRDWKISRIAEIRTHFAEVAEAMNRQTVVSGQAVEQLKGTRVPVPPQRIEDAGAAWSRVLARSLLESPTNVQHALARFDTARNNVALAVNAGQAANADAALAEFDTVRGDVARQMNTVINDMNEELVRHVLPWQIRAWARLRRRPLYEPVDTEPPAS